MGKITHKNQMRWCSQGYSAVNHIDDNSRNFILRNFILHDQSLPVSKPGQFRQVRIIRTAAFRPEDIRYGGGNIDDLKKEMKERALQPKDYDTSSLLVTSSRHRDGLQKARENVERAIQALDQGMTGDFLSIDLRAALKELGTITGEITNEDILDSIFSRFCIGK